MALIIADLEADAEYYALHEFGFVALSDTTLVSDSVYVESDTKNWICRSEFKDVAATQLQRIHTPEGYAVDFQTNVRRRARSIGCALSISVRSSFSASCILSWASITIRGSGMREF